ncbi:DUF1178 family protein [Enterovirga aerilata]|uniref:DUF1178 family protein n=1 Tax=Enterovirga aerilata TaxID=2730920 RepID=A0A849I1N2_9HYPH|nr:DUF1178 family protein [Enterovirga sp. DB1703]NNM71248.1 DUF1178 family protein [Enterovirga sp. DB1703]
MIRYALACDNGHEFESWFPSSASYDRQAERGLVLCPLCGSAKVAKQLMAPALGRKGNAAGAAAEPAPAPANLPVPAAPAPQPVALMSEREQAVRAMLRAVREHVTRNADYVGTAFAEEARKMHYGEIEHRSIYGEANAAEAKALLEEGIEFHPLPIVPDDRN